MSAPAQNVPPAPVSTSTRTAGSASSRASSGGSERHMPSVMAFRLAAWSMTTVAMPSVTECVSCGSVWDMRRMLSAGLEHAINKGRLHLDVPGPGH